MLLCVSEMGTVLAGFSKYNPDSFYFPIILINNM